jgi:hypothetical protein
VAEERWWKARAEAIRTLSGTPGVVGVGLGVKEKAGELTGDVAIILYVTRKKPAAAIDSAELLPEAVDGVPIDVREMMQFAEFGGTTLDGGSQIRRSPDDRDRPKPGTLAYVATRTTDNMNVMLSCEHVMQSKRHGDLRIFHPDVSRCCGNLKNAVGGVLAGKDGYVDFTNSTGTDQYFIDGAIASIISGVTGRKSIPGLNPILGSGDLTAAPVHGNGEVILAGKRGAVTQVTKGDIEDVAFPFPPAQRMIKIRPKAGYSFPFTRTLKVPPEDVADHLADFPARSLGGTATAISADEVRFDIPVFAIPGDSGAAVVDMVSKRIVGLIVTGSVYELRAFNEGRLQVTIVPTGFAIACHLPPILEQLAIRIDPSTETSAGHALGDLVPGDELTTAAPDNLVAINARLTDLERRLDATEAGRTLNALVRRHADEIVDLVHHRRRVLAEWHRVHGPRFAALLMRALLDDDGTLPTAVDEIPRETMLSRMRDILSREGSPDLKQELAANDEWMLGALAQSRTVDDLVARLS